MRSRYRILAPDAAHFITGTIISWLPIFTTAARCDLLVQAFEYCRLITQLFRASPFSPFLFAALIGTLP
jgi:hypothetical protein